MAGAAGFEPLHLEIRSAVKFIPPQRDLGVDRRAFIILDAQVQVLPPGLRVLENSDSNMQRFESRRPTGQSDSIGLRSKCRLGAVD